MSSDPRTDRVGRAAAWMALSGLAFTLMSVEVRRLSPVVPEELLVFVRGLVNFGIVFALMLWRREPLDVPGKPLLFFRGLMGTCGVTCLFSAIGHLPLPIAAMLNWCSPLFVAVFSRLFTQERLGPQAGLGLGVAMSGLFWTLRPDQAWAGAAGSLPVVPVLVGILGAAFGGAAYVAVRAATARVSVNAILLYFTATATVLSAPFAWRRGWVPLDGRQSLELLALGVLAALGQSAMTQGYRHAPAGVVSTLSLMNAVFSLLFGAVFFDERFGGGQLLGMGIVSLGVAMVALSQRQLRQGRRSEALSPVETQA